MTSNPTPKILTIGHPSYFRFVILADDNVPPEQRRYWTGRRWTSTLRLALLYADPREACVEVRKIRGKRSQS